MTDLRAVDVKVFLTELGIRNISERRSRTGLEIRFSCPFPGHDHGDSNPSAQMNADDTAYRCFGCGMKGNAVSFLSELEGVSPMLAARWIRTRFEGGWREVGDDGLWAEIKGVLFRKIEGYEEMPTIDEKFAEERSVDWGKVWGFYTGGADLPKVFTYLLDRRFSWDILESWGVGYDTLSGRVAIPARDHEGNLVGFKARDVHDRHPKYIVLGGEQYGFEPYEAGRIVFGLDRARFNTPAQGMILREGELNVISMHDKGFVNTAGISGQHLNPDQARLIKAYADEVVVWFDEVYKAAQAARYLEDHVRVRVCTEYDSDPAEMNRDEIEDALSSAVSLLAFDLR